RNYAILWTIPDPETVVDGDQGVDRPGQNLSIDELKKQTDKKLKAAHLPPDSRSNHVAPNGIGSGPAHFAALNEPVHVGNAPAAGEEGARVRVAPDRKPLEEGDIDTTETVGQVVGEMPLWVSIRVERDQKDWMGRTRGYGFCIPSLDACEIQGVGKERYALREKRR